MSKVSLPSPRPHPSPGKTSQKFIRRSQSSVPLHNLQLGCRPVPPISTQPSDLFHLCPSEQRVILSPQLGEPSLDGFLSKSPTKMPKGSVAFPAQGGTVLDMNSISDRSSVSSHARRPEQTSAQAFTSTDDAKISSTDVFAISPQAGVRF